MLLMYANFILLLITEIHICGQTIQLYAYFHTCLYYLETYIYISLNIII